MLQLPYELLGSIISFLDVRDVLRMAQCCRQLGNDIANKRVSRFINNAIVTNDYQLDLTWKYTHLKHMIVRPSKSCYIVPWPAKDQCNHPNMLLTVDCTHLNYYTPFHELFYMLPKLQTKNVTSLNFSNKSWIDCNDCSLDAKDLRILSTMPLINLDISNAFKCPMNTLLTNILSDSITTLNLSNTDLYDKDVELLTRLKLIDLDVSDCVYITDDCFVSLTKLPLVRLNVEDTNILTKKGIDSLANIRSLTTLGRCYYDSDFALTLEEYTDRLAKYADY